ncbi:hypothetical protein TRICHSKD4_3670 [Roseibium sp. TrichSKD4]|nr:hypothetical protein TRICHSKD4_3670 [Roseibium sp. TrichSKD4]
MVGTRFSLGALERVVTGWVLARPGAGVSYCCSNCLKIDEPL